MRAGCLAIAAAGLLAGCATVEQPVPPSAGERWGSYSGLPVEARWEEDGRRMTLLKELRYTDPAAVVWSAPAGARVDGASIPRPLWSLAGGPFEGKYRNASVLHDVAYQEKTRPWQEVDRMFYHAMRASGVNEAKAKTFYYAVYRFAPHWPTPGEKRYLAKRAVRPIDPAAAQRELAEIERWIETANPTLATLESRALEKGAGL